VTLVAKTGTIKAVDATEAMTEEGQVVRVDGADAEVEAKKKRAVEARAGIIGFLLFSLVIMRIVTRIMRNNDRD